jgi:2-oxo-4-hydroxy-4-carboxy--5-ureidoimidazoline (OHCU) decarboxylase
MDARKDLYAFAMKGKEHSPAISEKASEKIDAFRAAELRDFLWRLEQSSGHDVAAKLVEENPDLAELLSATEESV